tara:strand:+ start:660 stop:893 length:234 start_codon:yes stop_codon:yes gene_type:complete
MEKERGIKIINVDEKKQCDIHVAIIRFIFTEATNLKMQCNEISITVDPCYEDDKYVDIVIYDDSWNELKRTKIPNGL